jgi:hypothetical protein
MSFLAVHRESGCFYIYGSFNDAFNSSEHITINERILREWMEVVVP